MSCAQPALCPSPAPAPNPPASTGHEWFDSVQGLRAVAMTLVFLHHLGVQFRPFVHSSWPSLLALVGPLGTDLFFALSGALAYRSLVREPVGYLSYLRRRILRLYPVYLAIFAAYVFIELVLHTGRFPLPHDASTLALYARNLLLLPVLIHEQPILQVTWALGFIFAFYLIFPAFAAPIRRLPPARRPFALASLWAAAIAIAAFTDIFPLRASLLFAGPLVWALKRSPRPTPLLASAALAGLALRFFSPWPFLGTALAVPAILVLAMQPSNPLAALLGFRPLAALGYRSYSFYLAHGLPLLAASHFLLPSLSPVQSALAVLPIWLAAVATAECLHRVIEVPISLNHRTLAFHLPTLHPLRSLQALLARHAPLPAIATGTTLNSASESTH